MLVSFFKNHAFVCPIREQNITTKDNFSDERWGSAFWSSNRFSYLPFFRYKGSKHHFKWYVNFSFFVQFWWDLFHWIPLNKSFQHCAAICFSIRYRFFLDTGGRKDQKLLFQVLVYVIFLLVAQFWSYFWLMDLCLLCVAYYQMSDYSIHKASSYLSPYIDLYFMVEWLSTYLQYKYT